MIFRPCRFVLFMPDDNRRVQEKAVRLTCKPGPAAAASTGHQRMAAGGGQLSQ
ncbi:MAG: hypothetical protein QF841_01940 [Arenicellales bacterium]|nr:hypothetical protein [Arenicellales bacterium]MDP7563221.1 hypothetical protein [Arenicellales bacterium]